MEINNKVILCNENVFYKKVPFVISLSALFPEVILQSCISYSSNQVKNIRNFISYLLPVEYRLIDKKTDIIKCNDEALRSFWEGNTDNDSKYDNLYLAIAKNLLLNSPESISDCHNVIRELYPKLAQITEKMPADVLQAYKQEISELCVRIVNERSKFSGFSCVNLIKTFPILNEKSVDDNNTFITTLAHLVLLACTSSIWCKPDDKTRSNAEDTARKLMPCDSTNHIELSYHDGIAALPRICWSTLFPESLRNMVQTNTHRETPFSTREWFSSFIPDEFQIKNGKHFFVTDRSDGSYSNYWVGKNEGNACCKLIKDNIIQEGKKLSNKYEALINHITHRCRDVLSDLSNEYLTSYGEDINYLFLLLQNNSLSLLGIKELILPSAIGDNIQKTHHDTGEDASSERISRSDIIGTISQKLLYLVIIASTWTIWAKPANKKHAKELATILFPIKDELGKEDIRNILIQQANTKAAQKLEEAQRAFHANDIKSCGDLCREIISIGLADDIILGDAYYYLVRCHDEFNYHYDGYYNSNEFRSRALDYGSTPARKEWSSRRLASLLYLPKQEENPPFTILTNVPSDDYRISILLRSFTTSCDSDKIVTYIKKSKDFIAHIKPESNNRILLFDDDQEKNYLDLLTILDSIKNWNLKNETEKVFTKMAWKDYRIYIRLNETKYAALIDTALKHMDGMTIPVFIIDDNKLAAQYLLSHFPLFYPIRSLSKETLNSNDITINLNIISESDNDLTNWIIREAYWLGSFFYTGVTLAINVISPKKDAILSRLEYTCPGVFLPIPDSDKTSRIAWSNQDSIEQLESSRLFDNLEALRKEKNSYSYYIINCDSDISSLNLAIKIREWEIRNIVKGKAAIKTANFPVITYHCENLDISHMAESLVVHQEEYGDNWYNNYSIIPFNASYHYQFSEIDGGHFEKMSQSVHLQYCGCAIQATKEEKEEFLDDYFTRCYNRDSSMAVALSIPYRLFQMTTSTADHILPVGWVLKNTVAYSDSTSLTAMAKQAAEFTNEQELLNYERARWIKYMISRGWQPASSEDTIKFMKAGNPRRQLYIGLLHGCICSQEDLMKLQEKLYMEYKYNLINEYDERFAGNDPKVVKKGNKKREIFDKYLQYDIRSIKQTSDIIMAAWFPDRESCPTYFIEEER